MSDRDNQSHILVSLPVGPSVIPEGSTSTCTIGEPQTCRHLCVNNVDNISVVSRPNLPTRNSSRDGSDTVVDEGESFALQTLPTLHQHIPAFDNHKSNLHDTENPFPLIEPDDDGPAIRLPLPRFILTFISILLLLFISTLDASIVSTALKSIVSDLGGENLLPWIGSAYLLTSTSSCGVYGRLSEVFGRKCVVIVAVLIFNAGSVVCACAGTVEMLVVGRAIAGVGGGGLLSMIYIIISDIVKLEDRAKYQGLLNATSGIAAVIGPLVGGIFSDRLSWRWCFLFNIPISILATLLFISCIRFPPISGNTSDKLRRMDWIGMLLLQVWTVTLVTPLQLGGSVWEWRDSRVIGMFAVSVMVFGGLVGWEGWGAKEPLMPPELFNRGWAVPAILLVTVFMGYIQYGTAYYLSLFFQVCNGMSATMAGLNTVPLVCGIVFVSIFGGQLVSRTKNYMPLFYLGPIFSVTGITLITFLDANTKTALQVLFLLIAGIGTGGVITVRVIAIQSSVSKDLVAVATAVVQFCQLFGAMIGIAVTGTIFNNALLKNVQASPSLQSYLRKNATLDQEGHLNLILLRQKLPTQDLIDDLVHAFLDAFHLSYKALIPFPVFMFLLSVVCIGKGSWWRRTS
ncbi:major facilitator superfamily domain-containing protein [Chytridium lagenaria]|nr:major facilitator superfamily domain-containing protein [Chytridium lagenaria]